MNVTKNQRKTVELQTSKLLYQSSVLDLLYFSADVSKRKLSNRTLKRNMWLETRKISVYNMKGFEMLWRKKCDF